MPHAGLARWTALTIGCCVLLSLPVPPGLSGAQVSAENRRPGVPPAALDMPFEEVEVRLVMLHATVLDGRGQAVSSLTPADFVLEENGIKQAIAVFGTSLDQPMRIAFLLDVSGSMGVRGKLDGARTAVRRFVAALEPGDEVGLLIFADGEVRVESEFSTDREPFLARLARQEAYGQTALIDAVVAAPAILAAAGPGRKALVLITDGVDNASSLSAGEALRLARHVQVPVYALGLTGLPRALRRGSRGVGEDVSFLDVLAALAGRSGGELFPVYSAAETEAAVARIEARLRAQYVIGYLPTDSAVAGEFRRVELRPRRARLHVEMRQGYRSQP